MKIWATVVMVLAALDVVTTYFSLSLGSIEANPLFNGMDIRMMGLIKMVSYGFVAYFAVRFKLKTFLILFSGANMGTVAGNLMAIWTLKTM